MRAEHGKISQEEMAKILGICKASYQRKESGIVEFTFDELIKMSKYYNLPIDSFKHP